MNDFWIDFCVNGSEHTGNLAVTCRNVHVDTENDCVIYADHIRIELDESVIKVFTRDNKILWENKRLK